MILEPEVFRAGVETFEEEVDAAKGWKSLVPRLLLAILPLESTARAL